MKLFLLLSLIPMGYYGWKLTSRSHYEQAEYELLTSDGPFELRQYPDLVVATTATPDSLRGDDGSFMRLFNYISGENRSQRKVAMTIPVFMETEQADRDGHMAFVMPREVAERGAPEPTNSSVGVETRAAGRFAVCRFAGRMTAASLRDAENKLRDWMASEGLAGSAQVEAAAYDAPWTPGPLRRNEVLIRVD